MVTVDFLGPIRKQSLELDIANLDELAKIYKMTQKLVSG